MSPQQPPEPTYEAEISITLRRLDGGYSHGEGLTVQDRLKLNAHSFLELAAVLGRFHELAEQLRREQR